MNLRKAISLVSVVAASLLLPAGSASRGAGPEQAAINAILERAWAAAGIDPAPVCSDELYLRRVTLDLLGRIPTLREREVFLAQPDRSQLVARLLAAEEFVSFWAELWTTQLVGYDLDDASGERAMLADWLATQIRRSRPYDEIALELLTASGESAFSGPVNFLLRYPEEPIVKVSRVFLGIRLDCARCHDHPFDRWTQQDYAGMSRFFHTLKREEISAGNVRLVDVLSAVEAQEMPRFLNGAVPRTSQWRAEFGLFVTRSRPFARNFANRLWYHFLGRGIVQPVDDVSRENPPAVPELLEHLADEARRSRFDLRHMIRLICGSRAYQLDSRAMPFEAPSCGEDARGASDGQLHVKLFALRPIKPLLPEQLYAAACTANGVQPSDEERRRFVSTYYGDALQGDFGSTWEYRETVQGIMSRLGARLVPPSRDARELFLRYLGRLPQENELVLCAGCPPGELCYLLLHSSEFAFNH